MGHNDHLEDMRPELPPEAGHHTPLGFEPDREWLKTAQPELRQEAMREWFVTRFWDPAHDTPYISKEGGYLFVHGGPFDAEEELSAEFGDLCSEESILAAKEDVESDGILDWAPIHHEQDYDAVFEFEVNARTDPYQFLTRRIHEMNALEEAEVDDNLRPMLRQLLFGSLIGALEAYLADTMLYWVSVDKSVFRRFVGACGEFKKRKFVLSEIHDRIEALDVEVEEYLQNLVWHRLDMVLPMMGQSLQIAATPIGKVMKHVIVRHDIVHRGGKTKDGVGVTVSVELLAELRSDVLEFVDSIEAALTHRFPE